MRVGSTFSGIGGIDLGFERAGHTVAWQVEIDDNPRRVLQRHWPDTPLYGDITQVNGDDLEPVDILVGGFPCQDLSVAGNRAGLAGHRSGLFWEFARLASELSPQWVLIENVPGLLSSHGGRDFDALVGTLEELGYGWAYRTFDAQYFGVAQRRRRVFIVGHLGEPWSASGRVLFESEGLPGDPPSGREKRENVAAAVAGRPDESSRVAGPFGSLTGGFRSTDIDTVGAYVVEAFAQNQRDEIRTMDVVGALSAEPGMKQTSYLHIVQKPLGTVGANEVAPTMTSRPYKSPNLEGQEDAVIHTFSVYPTSGQGSDLAVSEIEVAPAVTATDGKLHERGARVTDGVSMVRRLTPAECERLQGFPDGWTEGHSKTQRYRMIGNAVAVPVAEWVARRFP